MKALSIKQPWAYFIARGIKTIEIRSWQTHYRGRLLICASQTPAPLVKKTKDIDQAGRFYTFERAMPGNGDYMHYGKAIAIAELYDVTDFLPSHEGKGGSLIDHEPGLFAWHLRNVEIIEPFAVKGQLGLFNVKTHGRASPFNHI